MTEQTTAVQANYDKLVDKKEFNFRFKKDKLGNQRQAVKLEVGIPSVEGIVAILEAGGKQLELLQEATYDVVQNALRGYVAENEDASQSKIDPSKFTWKAIANQPKEDRRSSAFTEEQWTAFATDYQNVMPAVTGKTAEQIGNAMQVYQKKFAQVKTNKPVLNALKAQLALYTENSKEAEQHVEILEMLNSKVNTYLESTDVEQLVANL